MAASAAGLAAAAIGFQTAGRVHRREEINCRSRRPRRHRRRRGGGRTISDYPPAAQSSDGEAGGSRPRTHRRRVTGGSEAGETRAVAIGMADEKSVGKRLLSALYPMQSFNITNMYKAKANVS